MFLTTSFWINLNFSVNFEIFLITQVTKNKMESKKRSILKAISYRIICIISMMVIMFLFTKNLSQSIYVTVIFQTIQTLLYYVHERVWVRFIP